MIDQYAIEERIAIRMASGMSEYAAKTLGDTDNAQQMLIDRVAALAAKQPVKPLKMRLKVDAASLAGNDREDVSNG